MIEAPTLTARNIPVRCVPGEMRQLVSDAAAAMLGPGVFDNCDWAAVFCELVGEMNPADIVAALARIKDDSVGTLEPTLQFAADRLRPTLCEPRVAPHSGAAAFGDRYDRLHSAAPPNGALSW